MRDTRLCTLPSLSETSGSAQVHRDWSVIETSQGIGGIISLETILVVTLLALLWDESAHLVVVSFPEDLIYGLLGDDTVDCSLFEHLIVVAGGWFEDIFSYAWDEPSYKVSIGGGISERISRFSGQLFEVLDVLVDEGPGHFDAFKTCAGAFAFLGILELLRESV